MGITKLEDWAVKAVKTFEGMEGIGFNCNLYLHGRKVARCIDDASGGPIMINWDQVDAELAFADLCKSLPKWGSEYGESNNMDVTEDILISRLVDTYEENRILKRHCRNKVLFRCEGDDNPESWRTLGLPFTEKVVASLNKRYPDITEIANYRFAEPKQEKSSDGPSR